MAADAAPRPSSKLMRLGVLIGVALIFTASAYQLASTVLSVAGPIIAPMSGGPKKVFGSKKASSNGAVLGQPGGKVMPYTSIGGMKYLMRVPPNSVGAPVVIFLHNTGHAPGSDLWALLPNYDSETGKWKAAKPGADRLYTPIGLAADGSPLVDGWIVVAPVTHMPEGWQGRQTSAVLTLVSDALRKSKGDPKRVYLTGVGSGAGGGAGVWTIAGYQPKWFAAVAPVDGNGDLASAPALRAMPIWASFRGGADTAPARDTAAMAHAVKAQNNLAVRLEEGDGDEGAPYTKEAFWKWLLSHTAVGVNPMGGRTRAEKDRARPL